jgi:hypothetical protein
MLHGKPYHITLVGLVVTAWDDAEARFYNSFIGSWAITFAARAIFYAATDNGARFKMTRELLDQPFRGNKETIAEIRRLLKSWFKLSEERKPAS